MYKSTKNTQLYFIDILESLLLNLGVQTVTKCIESSEDFSSAITIMKKQSIFNILMDIDIELLPELFEDCR